MYASRTYLSCKPAPVTYRIRISVSGNRPRSNLVPRASFPLTSGRKTRALGATISGMRHRCRCAVSRITRIRLFPLFFHNGCSQSSRFPTAGQGERSSGNEIGHVGHVGHVRYINIQAWLRGFRANFSSFFCLSIPKRDLDTKKTTPNIEV